MISQERINLVKKLLDDSFSLEDIAEELEISYSTAERYGRLARNSESPKKIPKILLFDIETVMMEAYIWHGKYKQIIQDNQIIKDWNMVAWAGKWLFDSEITYDVQTPEEAVGRDDSRILGSLWEMLDEADIVIAHNCDKFDIRKANARFVEEGYLPYSPIRTIDTLKVAKRYFAFSSYELKTLCQKFGIGDKIDTGGYELWKNCLKGDKESLDLMSKYNTQDVNLLEELYLIFRPWIKSHPNVALYMDLTEPVCTNCGSEDLEDRGDYYTTNVRLYKAIRCADCGAWGRKRKSELSKEENKNILMPCAR